MNPLKSSSTNNGKTNDSDFDIHALEIFRYQAANNPLYQNFLLHINVKADQVSHIEEIPFLPIDFFKQHSIKANDWDEEIVFESSGTTMLQPSRHFIRDLSFYHQNAKRIFEEVFGPVKSKTIIGLLPSYLERANSSLVSMVNHFISMTDSENSGFYLDNTDELIEILGRASADDEIILFGVSFALLDLAERYSLDLSHITIIETGGMKGRRREIIKDELYEVIKTSLGNMTIYSEYGMTELLSQAYGLNGKFNSSATMEVLIRDINDPFSYLPTSRTGGINVIDLANRDTCSFIETKDLGRINHDGTFEVLGRFDNSDIRGCNLMVL